MKIDIDSFWVNSQTTSDTVLKGKVKYSCPHKYGIHSEIITNRSTSSGNLNNYMKYTFYKKKKNSAKYINKLKADLPNIAPATIDIKSFYTRQESTDYSWYLESEPSPNYPWRKSTKGECVRYIEGGKKLIKYQRSTFKVNKKNQRIGSKENWFLYNEFLRVEVSYPLMFATDFRENILKIIYIRDLISKLLSTYKNEDDINKLLGKPVTDNVDTDKILEVTRLSPSEEKERKKDSSLYNLWV